MNDGQSQGPAAASWSYAALVQIVATSTVVGVPAARVIALGRRGSRWLEAVVLVPLGVSAATLGFGYLLAFAAFVGAVYALGWLLQGAIGNL